MWTEKYRPQKFDEVVGRDEIIDEIKNYLANNDMPHMIFIGAVGSGKTTLAHVIGNEYLDSFKDNDFLEINGSDDRGIDVIRNKIIKFAKHLSWSRKFKIIFLDEADALTPDAQFCLRRPMEIYAHNCRFIFTGNEDKFHDAIKDRCKVFEFKKLDTEAIVEYLKRICTLESIQIDDTLLNVIAKDSKGSMRKAVQELRAKLRG